MRAFLTGSRAYGTPREDSDIDIVVVCEPEALKVLNLLCDNHKPEPTSASAEDAEHPNDGTFRFGPLNLICVPDEEQARVWKECTALLKECSPVTRDQAVKLIRGRLDRAKQARKVDYKKVKEAK